MSAKIDKLTERVEILEKDNEENKNDKDNDNKEKDSNKEKEEDSKEKELIHLTIQFGPYTDTVEVLNYDIFSL